MKENCIHVVFLLLVFGSNGQFLSIRLAKHDWQNNTIYFLWHIKLFSFIVNAIYIYINEKFHNYGSDFVSGGEESIDLRVSIMSISQVNHFNNYEICYEKVESIVLFDLALYLNNFGQRASRPCLLLKAKYKAKHSPFT